MKILSKCVSKCEYAEGSYPINGFIRSCWGKQTYKNEEGKEKLCFLTYLNVEERNKMVAKRKLTSDPKVRASISIR